MYLKSVKLAVEVDGEQQDVEDYGDHVEDKQLGDQGPEWDFETQVKFVDHDQRQNVTWAIQNKIRYTLRIKQWPIIWLYLCMNEYFTMTGRDKPGRITDDW